MNRFTLIFCGLAFALGAAPVPAQTNAAKPAAPAPPNLVEPLSSTTPDNTRYVNFPGLLTQVAEPMAEFKNKPCDIIFIGDSITKRWRDAGAPVWAKNYANRNVLDFGIDGDKTQNVLWRLNNMDLKTKKPKVAMVMIGTNNGNQNTPVEIAAGVKAVLADTHRVFPKAKIILVSLLPNQFFPDKMAQADAIIKNFANNRTIYWLDLASLMPPVTVTTPDGKTVQSWKGLGDDILHPNATGYQIWAEALNPLLAKLMAGSN